MSPLRLFPQEATPYPRVLWLSMVPPRLLLRLRVLDSARRKQGTFPIPQRGINLFAWAETAAADALFRLRTQLVMESAMTIHLILR